MAPLVQEAWVSVKPEYAVATVLESRDGSVDSDEGTDGRESGSGGTTDALLGIQSDSMGPGRSDDSLATTLSLAILVNDVVARCKALSQAVDVLRMCAPPPLPEHSSS
jgi:hypothetical protein